MSILICTPCYGAQMTVGYFRSIMDIRDECAEAHIDVGFLVTEGESLITRARNNLVATFMNETDFEAMAFIDADIEITGADFITLARMSGVRGAAVNMKMPGHPECLSCFKEGKQLTRAAMPDQPFAVDYLGAAVMFIDRTCIAALIEAHPRAAYDDPIIGTGHALFESEIADRVYLSEDYSFCRLLKKEGIDVICDPDIVVNHYGASVWRA